MYELFSTQEYMKRYIQVNFSQFTGEWNISGKTLLSRNDVAVFETYGTSRANAYKILEDTLNLRDVRIYDTVQDADGKEKRVLNSGIRLWRNRSSRRSKMLFGNGYGRNRTGDTDW